MNETLAERYAAALLPDTYRVLGRRLQPLCIGHVITLQRLRSPWLVEGREPDAADLAQAVLICSWRWPEVRQRLTANRGFRLRLLSLRALWDIRAVVTWKAYLDSGLGGPRLWDPDPRESKALASPNWLTLHARLQRVFHMNLDEALSTPVRLARWLIAQADEERGMGSMVTPEEEELMHRGRTTAPAESARN